MRALFKKKLFRASVRTFVGLFLTFGLFTTFVPCQYSSKRSVMKHLGMIAHAQQEGGGESGGGGAGGWGDCDGDCDCNSSYSGQGCLYAAGCTTTEWGCGPFWLLSCTGCRKASQQ